MTLQFPDSSRDEDESLLREFKKLLEEIGTQVGTASVLPAITSAQDRWERRMNALVRKTGEEARLEVKELGTTLAATIASLSEMLDFQQKLVDEDGAQFDEWRKQIDSSVASFKECLDPLLKASKQAALSAGGLQKAAAGINKELEVGRTTLSIFHSGLDPSIKELRISCESIAHHRNCLESALRSVEDKANQLGALFMRATKNLSASQETLDSMLRRVEAVEDSLISAAQRMDASKSQMMAEASMLKDAGREIADTLVASSKNSSLRLGEFSEAFEAYAGAIEEYSAAFHAELSTARKWFRRSFWITLLLLLLLLAGGAALALPFLSEHLAGIWTL